MNNAPSKKLSANDIRELLALEPDELTMDKIRELFACFMGQNAPKYNTYDKFTLPAGRLGNDTPIETTVGRYIVNLLVIPASYREKYGYVNKELTKKNLGAIEKQMGEMLLDDEMTVGEYATYLDRGEWLGMGSVYFLGPSLNYNINLPIKEVTEKRDELFEKNKEAIKRGDSAVAEMVEKEVLKLAKDKLEMSDNEAYDFYRAGIGTFENHYKKTSIMGGAIENPYTKKLDIMKSNYTEGVSKEEYPKYSNLTLVGGYSRGIETQTSGYEAKKIRSALQTVVLDEDETDCGTTHYLEFVIPKEMKDMFINRYVLDGGKLTLLTNKNIDQFVGKNVKMRSPMYCKGEKICSVCAGKLFYKLGIKNVGLVTDAISGVLMNASMKKFHDATVKFTHINIEEFIKEV